MQPGREVDTQAAAVKYLDDHNIHAIMEVCVLCRMRLVPPASQTWDPCDQSQELFTALLYHQPGNPLEFVVSECARLHKERARRQPVRWKNWVVATAFAV